MKALRGLPTPVRRTQAEGKVDPDEAELEARLTKLKAPKTQREKMEEEIAALGDLKPHYMQMLGKEHRLIEQSTLPPEMKAKDLKMLMRNFVWLQRGQRGMGQKEYAKRYNARMVKYLPAGTQISRLGPSQQAAEIKNVVGGAAKPPPKPRIIPPVVGVGGRPSVASRKPRERSTFLCPRSVL